MVEIAWGKMIKYIIAVAVVIVGIMIIYSFFKGIMSSSSDLSVEPKCDPYYAQRGIKFIHDSINTKISMQDDKGDDNSEYDPEEAVNVFDKYIGCKETDQFTIEELEQYDALIMSLGTTSYVRYAEQICNDMSEIKGEDRFSQEKKEGLMKEHGNLLDEYDKVFKGASFPGSTKCYDSSSSAPAVSQLDRDLADADSGR